VHKLPPEIANGRRLFLADILPTSYEVGVLRRGSRPGGYRRHVAGDRSAAVMTQAVHAGRIVVLDVADARLEHALAFGADIVVNNGETDPLAEIMELTNGLGVDVAIEAVGIPDTFELCAEIVRPGGHVANVGVHGAPATLHLEKLWIKDVTITTGLVDTSTTPRLLELIANGRLDPTPFATHRFELADTEQAYETFADAASTNALKVVLSAEPAQPPAREQDSETLAGAAV
jgi:alcohol dehydrogenase